MAFRQLLRCYTCNHAGQPRHMTRVGEDNNKQQLALVRRAEFDLPEQDIAIETRVCLNCNTALNRELAALGEDHLRLNVIVQRHNRGCFLCNAVNDVVRISTECRVFTFVNFDIFIPENVRICPHHVDANGNIFPILINGIRYINRPYVIRGQELQTFLRGLQQAAQRETRLEGAEGFDDAEFECLFPINKAQFEELFTYCDPVQEGEIHRYVSKKDLMVFLCKLRQGLSDEFLKVLFKYPSRQAVSMSISIVRRSLLTRFVRENIGLQAITREEFINRHVSPFANELYNPHPDVPQAILICDATYAYIDKASNFRTLRQSYSLHKNRHLLKPTMIVATDGYILDILGPHFSDYWNNDASIFQSILEERNALTEWIRNDDIFLIDRGYRDVVPLLEQMGVSCKMPAIIQRHQRQLTTEDANSTRLITKVRWMVEARNGHIKTIFKFFQHVFNIQNALHIGDYYRIVGAIINKYHPLLEMRNATVELAREMLQRARVANVVQARLDVENILRRPTQWIQLRHQVPEFPRLTIDDLQDLTYGVFQVNLANSYIQDKTLRERNDELQFDQHLNEANLIRIQIYSKLRRATKHQLLVSYIPEDQIEEDDEEVITGYYCTCQSGARTLGTCAHVASVLWYLGYARHQAAIKWPQSNLLHATMDAANRPPEVR